MGKGLRHWKISLYLPLFKSLHFLSLRKDGLYLSQKALRAYPSTLRSTDERYSTYKIRTIVERSINQLIGIILADRIKQHQ